MTEASKSDLTRKRIIEAGRGLLLRYGFSGVGLARILAESGVPKGSFYYYFESKEAFGAALLEDYIAGYLARFESLMASPGTAGDKLSRFWDAWMAQADHAGIASECLVVKLGAEIADLSGPMREILDSGVDALVERIAFLLREGAADGSLNRFDDPDATARMLYARWLGAAILAKLAQNNAPLRMARAETAAQLTPTENITTD